jgi:16S rRNA (guanine527-N7)-methyltransferase
MVRAKVSSKNNNDLQNGIIYLKGGDFEEEITPFKQQVKVYEIQSFFKEEFFETKKLIHMALKNK